MYVRVKDTKKPTFEGREIALGPRAGAYYIVKSGLEEGELVVTRGNFKIDSALQIQAKPSMMSPEGGGAPAGHDHGSMSGRGKPPKAPAPKKADVPGAFRKQITGLWQAYVGVADALARDDFKSAAEAGRAARRAVDAADMKLLEGHAHMAWMKELPSLKKATRDMTNARDIEKFRAAFALLSEQMPAVIRTFGLTSASPVYVLKCPMAFNNRGATWLQKDKETRNPYFGARMFKCGSVVDTIAGESDKPAEGRTDE